MPTLLLALFPAARAAAQAPGANLQLVPKIGAYLPANDLGEVAGALGDIRAEMEASLALGLALELDLPTSPVNLRANFDYATASEVSPEGITSDVAPDATLLALTGDLVFRPLPRIIVVQPYLLGGAGVKVYQFDTDDLVDDGFAEAFDDDRTDFALHAGIGVDVGLGPLALLAEVSDYISWFELQEGEDSEMQNDFFAMVGFRVGLF
ncbi:MAG TPA: hypothetical protein VF188_08450 [Longimicrobiales bacterium]